MTGRFGRIRQVVGYAIGFVAAFVLWLLLGAATAHADDEARPTEHARQPALTSALVGVVDQVTAPLVQDSDRVVHRTTATVRKSVAAVPLLSAERHVEPVLRLVDRTADRVEPVAQAAVAPVAPLGPVAQAAAVPATGGGVPAEPVATAAPALHRADTGGAHRHVAVHRPARAAQARPAAAIDPQRLLRPATPPSAHLDAVVSSTRAAAAHSGTPAAVSRTTPLAGLSAPTPGAPADRTSTASPSSASTEAAPSLLASPRLPAAIALPVAAPAGPRSAADPLPACSPD